MDLEKQIEELENNGETIYSISRLDTINNCMYEAYRTYKLDERGDNNIYGIMGSKIHNTLEDIINNKAEPSDLYDAMNDELADVDMFNICFPNDMIKNNWIANMTHFCKTYIKPEGSFITEERFLYKTDNNKYLQGFIDLIEKNEDGSINIFDYKTSSMYSKNNIKEHGRQLVIYAMGKEQQGYDVKKVAWNFLKYATVEFKGYKTAKSKEKTEIIKNIERRKIPDELAKFIERDLYNLDYDELLIDALLVKFKKENSFDVLPDEIKNNYIVKPCIVEYEITDEVKEECKRYIDKTITMWENAKEFPHRCFTRINKNNKEVDDIFYCTNLCGHFKNCDYIQDYLYQKQINEQEDNEMEDLFS